MKNVAASVRARLLNQSRLSGESFNSLLDQYVTGRFLWRLSESPYQKHFILKGAQLFRLWNSNANIHRPTRDLDLLGFDDPSEENLAEILTEVCRLPCSPDDGLLWGKVQTTPIREEMEYGGIRAQLFATLAEARISLQIDVGFGDAVTPAPVETEWLGLLGFPAARLLVYPPETMIAEKLEAAVVLGMGNSRMKDFFDLYWLSNNQTFNRARLTAAVEATFQRRKTAIPDATPLALTEAFGADASKAIQWNAFLRKGKLEAPPLSDVIGRISDFLLPVLLKGRDSTSKEWISNTGWTNKSS